MLSKKHLTGVLLFILFLFSSLGNVFAQQDSDDLLPLVLDMYKFDQYLPAIDILEANQESQEDNANYWIYLGLAFQRTNQLNKALEAYKRASNLNVNATNLETRISNLKKIISGKDEYEINNFTSDNEKANWLFALAEKQSFEKNNIERSFRTFIQAVEYNVNYLSNDKNFVRKGAAYYRLKTKENVKYSKLFCAIFTYFEGDVSEAYKCISQFQKEKSEKSPAILRMESIYLKKIAEAKNQIKEFEKAEKQLAKAQKEEEKKKLAILEKDKPKTGSSSTKPKSSKNENSYNNKELENEKDDNSIVYINDTTSKKFANKIAIMKASEYFSTNDLKVKKLLIWEMGHTGSQSDEVMNCIIDGIKMENYDILPNCVLALTRIGSPSADKAIPSLVNLLDSDKQGIRLIAIGALSKLNLYPSLVVEKLIAKYNDEDNNYMKDKYAECLKGFGEQGLNIAYKKLNDTTRLERKPIAVFINKVTGEKIQDLINR